MGLLEVLGFRSAASDPFFTLLARQGVVIQRATETLATFRPRVEGGPEAAEIARHVQAIEHEGDQLVRSLEGELGKSFVTPLDREDLRALAVTADDVVDKLNLTARSFVLFGLGEPSDAMCKMMDLLRVSGVDLAHALALPSQGKLLSIGDLHQKIKDTEREGDRVFREAIATLFREAPDDGRALLREKELLEDLEGALDLCEDTAETLLRIAVKHG